jgi:hypothetical protein
MGHKVPECYKKKRDELNQKQHENYDTSKDPLYLFTIISKPQHHSHQWFFNEPLYLFTIISKPQHHSHEWFFNDPLYLFTIISKPQHHSHQWFLNSDVNQHMSPLKNISRNYNLLDNPKTIFLGDNSSYQALGYGSILIQTSYSQTLIIHNVLYVPGLTQNLLSIPQTTITSKTIVTFTNSQCIITTTSPFHHQNVIRIDKEGKNFPPNFGIKLDA